MRADSLTQIGVGMGIWGVGKCLATGEVVIVRFVGFIAVRFAGLPRNDSRGLATMHQLGQREGMWAIEEL